MDWVMKLIIILISLLMIGCAQQVAINQGLTDVNQMSLKLTSPAFQNNGNIPSKYTCMGNDTNPELRIEGVPKEAKSLVLIMDDPDAIKPAGKVWDHWIIFNIPVNTKIIPEGKEPEGIHGLGTSNNLKYHGPCPPDGQHAYIFKLYALDNNLGLEEGSTKQQVEKAMQGHILAQTKLVGLYLK